MGFLGKDPETRTLESGMMVSSASLATSESYKDRQGNKVDQTEWHNIEFWDRQAEIAGQYLKKGSQIYLEGKIKTDTWEKDGQKHYRTKIRVQSFTMLGGNKAEHSANTPEHSAVTQHPSTVSGNSGTATPADFLEDLEEDKLPF